MKPHPNLNITDFSPKETPIAMIFRILEEFRPSQELKNDVTEPPRLWPPFQYSKSLGKIITYKN